MSENGIGRRDDLHLGQLRGGRQPDDQVVPVKHVGGHAFGSALIDGMVGGLFGNGHVFLLKNWEGVTTGS